MEMEPQCEIQHDDNNTKENDNCKLPLDKIQEFQVWRRKLSPLFHLLRRNSETELEKIILASSNDEKDEKFLGDVQGCEKVVDKCKALYAQLEAEVKEAKQKSLQKWDQLIKLMQELKDEEEFGLCFSVADKGVGTKLDDLQKEITGLKVERLKRIETFIGDLRKNISDIWDACMISEEEKKEFSHFYSAEYTEELLKIHREELQKWQSYYRKNQEVLKKMKEREEMWRQLREVEARADDPNRFVNRGGQLLKDQTLHAHLMKALPLLEKELKLMSSKFEKEMGKKLRILGKEIPIIITEEWTKFNEEKTKKKQNKKPIATPASAKPGDKRSAAAAKLYLDSTPASKNSKLANARSTPNLAATSRR